jgi:hypothetical protein
MVTLRNIFILSMAIIMSLIYGCSDLGVMPPKHTSTFPLTVGSRWQCNTISWEVLSGYTTPQYVDTTEIFRQIIGRDSLGELMNWIAMEDSFNALDGNYAVYKERRWLGLQDGKLKIFAHQIYLHGQPNQFEIYRSPYIMLDFPLYIGKSWRAYDSLRGGFKRNVLGSETIFATGHKFNCDIVGTRLIDDWEHPDNYPSKEWYPNDGLIASSFDTTQYHTDEHGAITDSVQFFWRMELLDINITRAKD